MKETWKDVIGFKDYYKVSSHNKILSVARYVPCRDGSEYYVKERILVAVKTCKTNKYPVVCLSKDGKRTIKAIHRVVLEAFRGPCPEGMEACHNDGNPENNNLSNLRWDTPKANAADREYQGRTAKGWKLSAARTSVTKRQALMDLRLKCGYSIKLLADIFEKDEKTVEYLIATYDWYLTHKKT